MPITNIVKRNRYQDSVTLMQVAVRLRAIAGVNDASLMMGTEPNKEMLGEAALLAPEGEHAGPNDLIIALSGTEDALANVEGEIEALLRVEIPSGGAREAHLPRTIEAGIPALPGANLVLISTPGLYAAAEARKALLAGLHVMVFSDNVAIDDEQRLKTLATERGLLLMGPDCGTAIIGGVPIGFANVVRHGNIGVVGASGTGMQEVTSLVDRYGGGVSHAIGTGSRDLSHAIGGTMTLAGLSALLQDDATSVIVLVSKPPHPEVAERVLDAASRSSKSVVVAFLGLDVDSLVRGKPHHNIHVVDTLEGAARQAVELAGGEVDDVVNKEDVVASTKKQLASSQRYLRGLFSGGTFCYEAMLLMRRALGGIYSNTPLSPDTALTDAHRSKGHTCLDMGADEFTVGRPHPMIDLSTRQERILFEAGDTQVGVLLLDIVLGYGAHANPGVALAETIKEAKDRAHAAGRALPVVASICGTERDPQGFEAQRHALLDAGVILAPSNAAAARLASAIVDDGRRLPTVN